MEPTADIVNNQPPVLGALNDAPEPDDNLVDFIEILQRIDTAGPLAKENETTMSDNNGGRIQY